jgi:hypothetical protein
MLIAFSHLTKRPGSAMPPYGPHPDQMANNANINLAMMNQAAQMQMQYAGYPSNYQTPQTTNSSFTASSIKTPTVNAGTGIEAQFQSLQLQQSQQNMLQMQHQQMMMQQQQQQQQSMAGQVPSQYQQWPQTSQPQIGGQMLQQNGNNVQYNNIGQYQQPNMGMPPANVPVNQSGQPVDQQNGVKEAQLISFD